MKKLIIALPILLGVAAIILLLAVILKAPAPQTAVSSSNFPAGNLIDSQPGPEVLSASQKGVDLTINRVKRENDQTVIELALNNHVYDLSKLEVKSQSSLAGINPSGYRIINSASGGHHLEAQMVFPGNLSGALVIKFGDLLVFNFNI
ncbi:MAG: hypothetical protein A3B89_01740 [Candidatus Buchananbacteria bacterium RIFCSPHIGHO2_02_FULL_40_13]|uniref:DUF4352 domain-containing protein n=1 Tax=Candidatus Buchananbacteria bacterium RIFCSPLOWO2_01_FULL_39_33 TaxID=1797543 RepID=A0A1G1YLC3_9BACT|nr:MAG: hypothetical protein A3B89_01740 [Candidatus Buchananbacteria bacterium RIFCSPHIGHO2_02_FULL_40_13]OGY52267.1 MAG: hypothetical protein A3A02_01695 [Candidatus Buchananbacteria bacterium RIFCSPLOWO2_01_FULL_39_33]